MQASGYGEKAAEHLRKLNADPEQKKLRALETKARWDSGEQRQKVGVWQSEHRDEVLESARHAREHLTTTSQLHLRFKAELEKVVPGFITEYKCGWYSIDEAMPDIKLAVEVDGCYWHGCESCGFPGNPKIKAIDAKKQGYLTKRGWTILRIQEHRLNRELQFCLGDIQATVLGLSAMQIRFASNAAIPFVPI